MKRKRRGLPLAMQGQAPKEGHHGGATRIAFLHVYVLRKDADSNTAARKLILRAITAGGAVIRIQPALLEALADNPQPCRDVP
jgi:hypothetical protein